MDSGDPNLNSGKILNSRRFFRSFTEDRAGVRVMSWMYPLLVLDWKNIFDSINIGRFLDILRRFDIPDVFNKWRLI